MAHILQSSTVGNVGSLRIVVPNRPASHKRAYVYCSLKGQRGSNSESFIIYLDTLEIKNYSASKNKIEDGLTYVQDNLENCKKEWNRVHPEYPIN